MRDVRRGSAARRTAQKALTVDERLPFVFEASGSETQFTNGFDPPQGRGASSASPGRRPWPGSCARRRRTRKRPTWQAKVRHLPPLDEAPLRPAQITAIYGVERSLVEQRSDRSLVQITTGAGRPTPRSRSPTGCSSTAASTGSCSWSTAQPGRADAGGVPELPHPDDAAGSPSSTTSPSSPAPACSARPRSQSQRSSGSTTRCAMRRSRVRRPRPARLRA